ncbi:NUDIX domain-containing protein [Flavobacterium sp. K77]|uniref:NUDIX hydrolase n=1 Tax=Flavobacterium sp. K77 TaxID=2910676 RepID=UPI001F27181A|nr:NUDIX domain-containing protein [Flavobacterium sp. K77]MCF6140837.1 NUDIX domain-containing protein [Flavobacterium sp. K77]
MTIIDKIAWIFIENRRILSTKSFGKDKYYLPGGKREGNETDQQTLVREIKEELNVVINQQSINYFGTFKAQAHGHASNILVQMICYKADYSGNLQASSEIEEVKWLQYSDREHISAVDQIIFEELKARNEID